MKEQKRRGKYSISVGPVKVEKPHQKCRGKDKEIKRARGEFTDLGSGEQGSVWHELSSLRQSHSPRGDMAEGINTFSGCKDAKHLTGMSACQVQILLLFECVCPKLQQETIYHVGRWDL